MSMPRIRFRAGGSTLLVGGTLVLVSFVVYLLGARLYNAGRGDYFYLADSFLHGRTWLEANLPPFDDVLVNGKLYIPFGPLPAVLFMPLVALVGPDTAITWQPIVDAAIAAFDVWLVWLLVGRLGVTRLSDRTWLAVLFGFSTAMWWITTRGGVWHIAELVGPALTLLALLELQGHRRAWLIGLLAGAAFLTRTVLVVTVPFFALWYLLDLRGPAADEPRAADTTLTTGPGEEHPTAAPTSLAASEGRSVIAAASLGTRVAALAQRLPLDQWADIVILFLPALFITFWYDEVRFGSLFETGYGISYLLPWLEIERDQGMFSVVHLSMNLDLLFTHLPAFSTTFPFLQPDGYGMSVFLTSPALLVALRADRHDRRVWILASGFVATLVPSLLYYGGGWIQYGYRYILDAIPFLMALTALAVARHGLGIGWKVLIVFGVLINAIGVYWAYRL